MTHTLDFKEGNVYTLDSLPADSDDKIIYIFRDTTNSQNKGYWVINKILYIGISLDAKERLNRSHSKIEEAETRLKEGHFLTFTFHRFNDNTSEETIRAVENALISENKPPLNSQNKKEYHFETYGNIEVICGGTRSSLLKKHIVLEHK